MQPHRTTFLNIAILGTATYKGVEHMDSVQFCGRTCHTMMTPEYPEKELLGEYGRRVRLKAAESEGLL